MNQYKKDWRYQFRVLAGASLHHSGLFRTFLPNWCPTPTRLQRRFRDYLAHYYREVGEAEVILEIPELRSKFCCDLRDHMLEPYLWGEKALYELKEIQHCRQQVKPGDYIVDIGANHGFWGIGLGKNNNPAVICLFEANPKIINRLKKTTEINSDLPIKVMPFAVTDGTCREVDFYLPVKNLSGLGSTTLHAYAQENGYLKENLKITVPSRSLDQLFVDGLLQGVDILKIDVEQAEDGVILGGLDTLKTFQPRLIMVETSNKSYAFKTLKNLGYIPYVLNEQGSETEIPTEYYWGNIFFRQ